MRCSFRGSPVKLCYADNVFCRKMKCVCGNTRVAVNASFVSLNKSGASRGRQMDYGCFHRTARRSVSECISEKAKAVEICRPNSLPRGLVEHWKFHGVRTNALTLARRFATAGFFFSSFLLMVNGQKFLPISSPLPRDTYAGCHPGP